ncbi:hypothetical protein FACS1894113_0420 [Alphaproteobacteria bacterium]|nr:hypothetical protein FACS1894113_0420 [Alphaproteobacteria bacterium]
MLYVVQYFIGVQMSEKIINIQDAFLNYMRKNKVPVTIFLLNGVKLTGIISCFDQTSIVVKREGYTQLVYKNAISTFSPHGPISVFDWNGPNNTSENFRKKPDESNNSLDSDEDSDIEDDVCE